MASDSREPEEDLSAEPQGEAPALLDAAVRGGRRGLVVAGVQHLHAAHAARQGGPRVAGAELLALRSDASEWTVR